MLKKRKKNFSFQRLIVLMSKSGKIKQPFSSYNYLYAKNFIYILDFLYFIVCDNLAVVIKN